MPSSLLILHTHPLTEEESALLSYLRKTETIEVREIDMTPINIDYKKVTQAILEADRVQVW